MAYAIPPSPLSVMQKGVMRVTTLLECYYSSTYSLESTNKGFRQ
jgi:hypothetical protein